MTCFLGSSNFSWPPEEAAGGLAAAGAARRRPGAAAGRPGATVAPAAAVRRRGGRAVARCEAWGARGAREASANGTVVPFLSIFGMVIRKFWGKFKD